MINIKRLKHRMLEMAKIGATNNGGVTRLALSEEDMEARHQLLKWMEDIGATTRFDDFGNIYGRFEGTNPDLPVIMIGSHIDTVPKGGKFDGILGVLGPLEVLESMKDNGVKPSNPIEIVSFTNEEGARFTPQMLGSGSVTGQFSLPYTYDRRDSNGLRFEDELRKIGFLGDHSNRLNHVGAFIEMHIEQGPVLEQMNKPIGIVTGISGFSWLEVTVQGEANHSGTTPMQYRKDSLVASSTIIQALNEWAGKNMDGVVATVGKVHTSPGVINVVPGETSFTIDIRCSSPNQFNDCITEVKELIHTIVEENSLSYTLKEIRTHPPVQFSDRLIHILEKACEENQVSFHHMYSGAGHDAMYMSSIADTAMLFVPSVNGKSHCEEEETSWEDIEKGVTVLYDAVIDLAN